MCQTFPTVLNKHNVKDMWDFLSFPLQLNTNDTGYYRN